MEEMEIIVERGEPKENLRDLIERRLKANDVKKAMSRAGVERIDTVVYDGEPECQEGRGYTLQFKGKNADGVVMQYPVFSEY